MKLESYQGFFFDFDYTLAHSEKAILKCFKATYDYFQLPDYDSIKVKNTIGLPLNKAFMLLTGIEDEKEILKFTTQYKKFADLWMTDLTILYPEVPTLLKTLHNSGKTIGIISNKMASRIKETLTKEGLLPYVDILLGSDILNNPKPNPEGLLLALKQSNLSGEKCIYVGDHTVDAEFAKNAQVNFIGVLTGNTPKTDFAPYPKLEILNKVTDLLPLT